MSFTALGQYGKYKHSLTKEELANHKHNYDPEWVVKSSSNSGVFGMSGEGEEYTYGGGIEAVGKSSPFEIIQPSICVYIWERLS